MASGVTTAIQEECRCSIHNSKTLIDLYGKYREKVGTMKIRSLKQMWAIISDEMSQTYKMKINPNNCENRWRVLERNYKKYAENKNSTGQGKKYFEFSEEMDQIFAHKKNVHPEILLSSEEVHDVLNFSEQDVCPTQGPSGPSTSKKNTNENIIIYQEEVTKKKKLRKKISTIEKIRQDRLNYQQKRLEIENEKLQLLKNRNELIKERNVILQSQCCCKKNNTSYDYSIVGCDKTAVMESDDHDIILQM